MSDVMTPEQISDAKRLLERLEADHRLFLEMASPIKASVWIALLRDKQELIARQSVKNQEKIPAIVALGESMVLKALSGDTTALAQIADRVEGKVGQRVGDVDPESEARRADIQSVIEAVVTGLTNARLANPSDDALDVTPIDMSTERQDSDSVRRQEIQEAVQRDEADAGQRGSSLIQTNQEPEERDLSGQGEAPPVGRR